MSTSLEIAQIALAAVEAEKERVLSYISKIEEEAALEAARELKKQEERLEMLQKQVAATVALLNEKEDALAQVQNSIFHLTGE